MDTWGDVISRNYAAGRELANDFTSARFAKKAEKVRDQFAERAKAEGKNLEDYMPEIEEQLRALASNVGATRRGVTARGGQALDRAYGASLMEDVGRAADRRAGAAAREGNQAGARDIRANSQYALGNFDTGQGQQIAGDTIRATTGAMKPDGSYDMAKGAQALAGVGARYGDAGAANAQQQGATSFRLQAARAKADSLFNMMQDPSKFSDDQFAGAFEGLKENVPEMARMDLRKGPDDVLYLYTDGKATGAFDPKNATDMEEMSSLMSSFTKDPGASLQGYMQARIKSIEDQKTARTAFTGKIDDAIIDVIKNAKAQGIPEGVMSKIASASTGTGDSKGWQLQELGDEPGTYMMQKGGNVYRIRTNVPGNLESGEQGGSILVEDLEGNPVNPKALNAGDREGMDYTLSAVRDLVGLGNTSSAQWVAGQIRELNNLREQRLGGGSSASAPSGDSKQIQQDFKDLSGQHGFKITSGVRPVLKVGAGERSQHPKGTAADFSVKGKSRAEIDDFMAALRERGYEVIDETDGRTGTGPHIHAELPPGARTAVEAPKRDSGQVAGMAEVPAKIPDAQAAASAAAPRTALPGRGLGPDAGRAAATSARDASAVYGKAKAALEAFDKEVTAQRGTYQRAIPGRLEGVRMEDAPALQGVEAQVRARLVADLEAATAAIQGATADANRTADALTDRVNRAQTGREAQALYSKYGGSGDFFKQAQ